MVYLTRIEHFNAAHKLWNSDWSDEKNLDFFGKCANANWHGHNYELHVTVKGKPCPDSGFVFNAKLLGTLIKEHVIELLDHKNLNLDVEPLKGKFTSVENLAILIFDIMAAVLVDFNVEIHGVKLVETHSIYVEYFG